MKLGLAVGQALRNVRTEQNKSLRQISSKCFVSIAHLSEVERGHKSASPEVLELIAHKGLGITTEELLDEIYQALQGKEITNETL
jgi:transcriptional regulator with XRE-family HTH domain